MIGWERASATGAACASCAGGGYGCQRAGRRAEDGGEPHSHG